jgi:hypothetical protein
MRRCCGVLAAVIAFAWLATACGGGGGGGPTAPPTPPPPPPVSFTAAGTPGALTIHLGKTSGTADNVLRLEIRASEFADLYGLGFDLAYPAALLDYRGGSHVEGGFLSADGSRTELFAREVTDGEVIVGVSRLGDVGGVEGSGLVLTLDFTAVTNGSGEFSFSANSAFDSGGDRLDAAVWQAGEVRVNL